MLTCVAPDDVTENERSSALQALLRRAHLVAPADLGRVVAEEGRALGATHVGLYLVDYGQTTLVPLPGTDTAGAGAFPIHGTIAGRAFASSTSIELEAEGGPGRRLWLPLLDGTDRLGAMEMTFAGLSEPLEGSMLAACERFAHLAAMLIVSKDAYSDDFKVLRRRAAMTIPSDLMRDLVPPLVFATDDLVLAGLLEPSYDNGGDALDYALNAGVLHLAVFDAMGHGLAAAGVAAFALATYRNSRRLGHGLAETHAAIDAAVAAQYPTSRFVTALLAQLEVASGALRWSSAGHPGPMLLRRGRVVKTLEVAPSPPLGLRLTDRPPAVGRESLEPGDLLLLYTDGLTEARRPGGDLFTVERLGEFIEREAARGQPAPETLRQLREAIIERGAGALRDDATALLVEWRRGSERALVPQTV
jgi:serine phosphatase RsbU (regulator of sigma subunit)